MEPLELYEHSLSAPLDDLVVPSVQTMPPASVTSWRLPDADLRAYRRWGLPVIAPSELRPSFDAVIEDEDRVYYRLGTLSHADLVTAADTGTVEGFSTLETATVPRYWVNGSGALLVETAWRWYGVNTALRAAPFDDETYDRLDRFFELVREKDPTVGEDSLWWGLVEGW
ncbi:SUKH-4 family immunity protein [Umezawaea tangerina]|uniref:SUKH-4 immunity protein of toxin-antitoxin system n=1 Tax=Umezawaea tangerina TaxID=84725 RepID=A0A2T0SGB2_9PSEU|nr:SUKH-4 family immunity protein [Umezawaea tangerina]PRY32447.1 SUKH-4 immunity protein of toxin-antitoxin system [Umezawaea tangerina]